MKRLFAAFLAVLLLTICACGGAAGGTGNSGNIGSNSGSSNDIPGMPGNAPGNPKPGLSGGNAPAYTGPGYAVMLKVTINPEFTLYLDEAQKIIRAEAVNEDAKTLFTELDVTGQSYADGMAAVLNIAYDQGYLKDGGKISIKYEIADNEAFDIAGICAPVTQFQQEKEIEVALSTGLYAEEIPEGQNTVIVNGQTLYIHRLPLLESGTGEVVGEQINYFTIEIPSNVTGYNEERWNAMVKSVWRFYDGSVSTTYYENGKDQYSIMVFPDGLIHYFVAGVDGFTTIYPPGYTATYQNEDGSTNTATFFDSGVTKTDKTSWPNGDYYYTIYREDGTMESYEHFVGGDYSLQSFWENGNLKHISQRGADGSTGESFYNENGEQTSYEMHWPNGHYDIQTFYSTYPTVKYKSAETMIDGHYSKILYHESGVMVSSEGKDPEGNWYKYTYHSNGQPASYEAEGISQTFYENGQVKREVSGSLIRESNADGSLSYYNDGTMEAYFSGGKLTKITVNGTTYTDAENLSRYAAGFGITQ